jgi:membrane-associated phospholipid phosphatase
MAQTIQKKIVFILILILICFKMPVAGAEESNFEMAGDILQIAIPATAYVSTFYMDDDQGRTQFYYSFSTNLAVTYGLKYAINKPRPEGHGHYAFPSGHTSAAFQGATFIQKRYGCKYGVPAFICASYVGWSRVEGESDKHDFADVAAGAAIGVLSSYYFTKPYKGFVITLTVSTDYLGVSITSKW